MVAVWDDMKGRLTARGRVGVRCWWIVEEENCSGLGSGDIDIQTPTRTDCRKAKQSLKAWTGQDVGNVGGDVCIYEICQAKAGTGSSRAPSESFIPNLDPRQAPWVIAIDIHCVV
jgi:hypothetical protein